MNQVNELTRREWDVLRLAAARLTNKQIARELHISGYTVKNHLHHIYDKTQTKSRAEAVAKLLNIDMQGKTFCCTCPIASKAQVLASELQRIVDQMKGT